MVVARTRFGSLRLLLLVLLVGAGVSRPAAAQMQIPDEFMNLEVLPKDISKDELTSVMRGFAAALGVRCTHCHVMNETTRQFEFSLDDKEPKQDARLMLEMTEKINSETIPMLMGTDGKTRVSCMTCHRGQQSPPPALETVLAETAMSDGVDAAIAKYRQMREQDLEAGLYDFRDQTLVSVGQRLQQAGRANDAVAWLKAAGDLKPKSADLAVALGMTLAQTGDTAGAKAALQHALELDPNSRAAKGALERLEGGGGTPPR